MGKLSLYESLILNNYTFENFFTKIEYAAIASLGLEKIVKVIVDDTYIGMYNIVLYKPGLNCLKQLENHYNRH